MISVLGRHSIKNTLIKDDKTISPLDIKAIRYCEYDSSLRIDNVFNNIKYSERTISSTFEANIKRCKLYFSSFKYCTEKIATFFICLSPSIH
jgi:hypothetical protein